MRRLAYSFLAFSLGCAGNEATGPSMAVARLTIEGPTTTTQGRVVQLKVTLRNLANDIVSGPVTFATSDEKVASVNPDGLLATVGAGDVTITAASGNVTGQLRINVLSLLPCAVPQAPDCATATYSLTTVNEQSLPVHSPWGLGDWDYDEDAGTWQLTGVVLTLFANRGYSYVAVHRAASGAIDIATEHGYYESHPDRVEFINNSGARLHHATWSAQFSGTSLIEGTVQRFVFARQ